MRIGFTMVNRCHTLPIVYTKLKSVKFQSLKKLYGPFLWMGFNCLKATEPLRR